MHSIYIYLCVCINLLYDNHSINLFPIPTRHPGTRHWSWWMTWNQLFGCTNWKPRPSPCDAWSILVHPWSAACPFPRLIASRCWKPSEDGVFLIDSWLICWLSACQTKWIVLLPEISYLAVSEGSNFSTWAWSHHILENSMIPRILRVSNTWRLGAGAGCHLPTGSGERVSAQTALWLSIWDAWYIGM